MTIQDLASTAEAFGRHGQPVGLSIVEVVVGVIGIVAFVSIFFYRKRRGLPVGREERIDRSE